MSIFSFLRKIQNQTGARAIITAHHRNDVLETAILSLMRNNGRKGVTSLDSREGLMRPLLHMTKKDIQMYAQEHALQWREDSTNADIKYLRNYVRHTVLPRIDNKDQDVLAAKIEQLRTINKQIDAELETALQDVTTEMDRRWFICLPHDVSTEIMAAWLRKNEIRQFDTKLIERLTVVAKTAANSSVHDVYKGVTLRVEAQSLALKGLER